MAWKGARACSVLFLSHGLIARLQELPPVLKGAFCSRAAHDPLIPLLRAPATHAQNKKAVKSPASSLATALLFLTGAGVNLAFLSLVARLGVPGAFGLFAGIAAAGAAFVAVCLPETAGRSLAEVQALLQARGGGRGDGDGGDGGGGGGGVALRQLA